eukprot:39907_1
MKKVNRIIIISYVSIQIAVTLLVSIIGALHVRRCLNQTDSESNVQQSIDLNENSGPRNQKETRSTKAHSNDGPQSPHKKHFCKLWVRTAYKLRSVYTALAVHCFDVLTDVLVIIQWLNTHNKDGDHIDPQVMAYSAIFMWVFSKLISSLSIYVKEGNLLRSILQLFDVLIFAEIYETHKKVVAQVKSKNMRNKKKPIEATFSFKYIRMLEAVFESIPESILQLVYVMRTGSMEPLFVISVIQSILSMTNAIINNDYTRMQDEQYADYKRRLPPTFKCMKHNFYRLSEVSYRIGLLSLFWTVCGGLAFAIVTGIEIIVVAVRLFILVALTPAEGAQFDADTILLQIYSLIVIPAESFYAYEDKYEPWYVWASCLLVDVHGNCDCGYQKQMMHDRPFGCLLDCVINIFSNIVCCVGLAAFISSISNMVKCYWTATVAYIPMVRMGTSLGELLFVVFYAFWGRGGKRKEFIFENEIGLSVFVSTIVFFIVYTQYWVFFPNFTLPFGVNIRSKYGYAYSNEFSELQKIKVPLKRMPYTRKSTNCIVKTEKDFWDEPFAVMDEVSVTPAVFALVQGNDEIVRWLENHQAVSHKGITAERAREIFVEHFDDNVVFDEKKYHGLSTDKSGKCCICKCV